MPNLDILKFTEGVIFHGSTIKLKLLNDLDLGGPDDLRFDLRGHLSATTRHDLYYML